MASRNDQRHSCGHLMVNAEFRGLGPRGYAARVLELQTTACRDCRAQAERASHSDQGDGSRRMAARYNGFCAECGGSIRVGDAIWYHREIGAQHVECAGDAPADEPITIGQEVF